DGGWDGGGGGGRGAQGIRTGGGSARHVTKENVQVAETRAQTVTVRTASGQELAYPWATSVRVDRRGDLRVMQGLRQRAFHACAEWASYTVTNLRQERDRGLQPGWAACWGYGGR